MPKAFLLLPDKERRQILDSVAAQLGRSALVLEKDVWVCWALERLWSTPSAPKMAFKGGTSLSKVYAVIERFSEDIDVTLDYRSLAPGFDPFEEGLSRNRLKKVGEELKERVRVQVNEVIAPHQMAGLSIFGDRDDYRLSISADGEKVRVHYRRVVGPQETYLPDSVLLEFGGRNSTEPSHLHPVSSYLSEAVDSLSLPAPVVDVLSGERTFWEKATLIHAECKRAVFRAGAKRLSRHWYDLERLADHEIGEAALMDRALLRDVVRHKEAFFHASHADYGACLEGKLRLVPDDEGRVALEADHKKMLDAGMYFQPPTTLEKILSRLKVLEDAVNKGGLQR